MYSRRSEPDIICDILRQALHGAGKTRIVYASNLNHVRAGQYLALLEHKGLLEVTGHSRRKVFRTTAMGCDLLERLDNALPRIRDDSTSQYPHS